LKAETLASRPHLGARSSNRGYRFQWLYVLRMLQRLFAGHYDGFRHEDVEDYVGWKDPSPGDKLGKTTFLQVKHSTSRACVLSDASTLDAVFDRFAHIAGADPRAVAGVADFVLVYNGGHDCAQAGCVRRARKRPAYRRLRKAMLRTRGNRRGEVRFEAFLKLPLVTDEVRAELEALEPGAGEISDLLAEHSAAGSLLDSLVCIVASVDGTLGSDRRFQDDRALDRTVARRKVSQALDDALSRARRLSRDAVADEQRARLRDRVRTDLQTDFFRPPRDESAEDSVEIAFKDESNCASALEIIHALKSSATKGFWGTGTLRFRRGEQFVLRKRTMELQRMGPHLRTVSPHHWARAILICTLLETLNDWSKVGVYLNSWRAETPQFRDLYLIVPPPRRGVVIADLEALRLYDPDRDGLLSSDYVRGPVVARAILYIYYGSAALSKIKQSRIYRAAWNDNVVFDFACWLRGSCLRIDDLLEIVHRLFASEFGPAPIIIDRTDERFLRDCLNNEFFSTIDGLMSVKPTHLLFDREVGQTDLWHLLGDSTQVTATSSRDHVTALRLSRYQRRRWRSNQDRDLANGVQLDSSGQPIPLMTVTSRTTAEEVANNIFGRSRVALGKDLAGKIARAEDRQRRRGLPPILELEDRHLASELRRLDDLEAAAFAFSTPRLRPQTNAIQIEIAEGEELGIHLAGCGYHPSAGELGLAVTCTDPLGQDQEYDVLKIEFVGAVAILQVSPRGGAVSDPAPGILTFADPGTEKVLKNDIAAITSLKASYRDRLLDEPPSKAAWATLEGLVGQETLPIRRSVVALPAGVRTPSAPADPDGNFHRRPADRLFPRVDEQWLVGGAPGTGKTRFAAQAALHLLDSLENRTFPPPRVVVVASSHYALDNFARVFRDLSGGRYPPYRHVPGGRGGTALALDVDGEVHEASYRHHSPMVEAVLSHAPSGADRGFVQRAAARLRHEREALVQETGETEPPTIIPSHEKWRRERLGRASPMGATQRARMASLLAERLGYLAEFAAASKNPSIDGSKVSDRDNFCTFASFGAKMIIATADAVYDLPDVACDLVIFEEAGQLPLVKMLKVLTKISRVRSDVSLPGIIFSGDPRQLPPFVPRPTPNRKAKPGDRRLPLEPAPSVLDRETPFEAAARRRPERLITLNVQYRMRPAIAEFVRDLFYPDEDWLLARSAAGPAIWWWDTDGVGSSASELDTPSLFNAHEVDVVRRLVRSLNHPAGDLLVISPYAAQVRRLEAVLGHAARVKTIDGCQGQEAHTVIVSLVSMRFRPGHDFVADPRRMNVAVSRASDRLHLVGDFAGLRSSLSRGGDAYGHMDRLRRAFDPSGPLAGGLRKAATL
jgi:hypothetical protein